MSFFEEEKRIEAFEIWIEANRDLLLDEDQFIKRNRLELAKQAFLDGFDAGKKLSGQDSWNAWNQK